MCRRNDAEKVLKATKDTADHSEIVSFVALSRLKKSEKTDEVDTESVYFSAPRVANDVAAAAHNTEVANAGEAMRT